MLTDTPPPCPRCGGAVNLEHHALAHVEDRFGRRTDEFLYCEFCERGWETSTYEDGEISVLHFVRAYEPVQFGKFLQRLENAGCPVSSEISTPE